MNSFNSSTIRTQTLSTLPKFSPLYKQIKDLLLKRLDDGVWKPGQVLPSEMELAVETNVSQGTVRKAIDELVAENLLVRHQGKGTYVATHSAAGVPNRFLRLRPNVGVRQPADSTILNYAIMPASAEIAQTLMLSNTESVILIERLLSFSGKPTVFEKIWLNAASFPGMTAKHINQTGKTLYAVLETEFGVRMIRAEERLRAVVADETITKYLQLNTGDAVLNAVRHSYSYKQQVVEVREAWYATQDFYYWNELD
jgi:GntR family transcriptional regulator